MEPPDSGVLVAFSASRVPSLFRRGHKQRVQGEALRVATRTRTALSLQQVRDVRRQLERWQDSRAVRELDEPLQLGG
jgi:hypothetical protein